MSLGRLERGRVPLGAPRAPERGSRPRGMGSKPTHVAATHDVRNAKSRPEGRLLRRCPGDDLLSHPVARAVPSALEGLTSGFGMGPGVSPPLWPPKRCLEIHVLRADPDVSGSASPRAELENHDNERERSQVLGLLVPVGSTRCRAYTSGLSTS